MTRILRNKHYTAGIVLIITGIVLTLVISGYYKSIPVALFVWGLCTIWRGMPKDKRESEK